MSTPLEEDAARNAVINSLPAVFMVAEFMRADIKSVRIRVAGPEKDHGRERWYYRIEDPRVPPDDSWDAYQTKTLTESEAWWRVIRRFGPIVRWSIAT